MASTPAKLSFSAEDLQHIQRTLDDLIWRVHKQREVLRQRGMDIPSTVLNQLEQVSRESTQVFLRVSEQFNELERLRSLMDTTAVINSSLDLDETLRTIMDTVLHLTGAERGYIMLQDNETGEMQVRIAVGMSQDENDKDSIIVSHSVIDQVVQTGQPIVTTNAQIDERFASKQSIMGYNLRSILCVPLMIRDKLTGVIYADNRIKAGLFGTKELQLLFAFASQSALAIENAKLYDQARRTLEQIMEFKTLLDNILASIASGVITTDADKRITTLNNSAELMLGQPQQNLIGRRLESVAGYLYAEMDSAMLQVLQYDEPLRIETEAPLADQNLRNLSLRLSPLKDASGTTQGLAMVFDDLTDLKAADARLQAVRRYLPPVMVDNIKSIEGIGLGGERRVVSVLFAELMPSTLMAETGRAGDLMERLNLYLTIGTEAIHRHTGLVDKYMGSEIMALFNTQLNRSEDHAWDALQAALDMIQALRQAYRQSRDTVYFRLGIHTGEATLGNVGSTQRREFTALGDSINLGKRLEENARNGELLISEATYLAAKPHLAKAPHIDITPQGTLQVKGRQQATPVYKVSLL
jgi:PAS domain S-box-containing protein